MNLKQWFENKVSEDTAESMLEKNPNETLSNIAEEATATVKFYYRVPWMLFIIGVLVFINWLLFTNLTLTF